MALGNLVETLKHVDVAFVTLFGGLILGRLAGKLCARLLKEAEVDQIAPEVSDVLGALVSYVVYLVTVLLVLQQFGLTRVAFILLAAAGTFVAVAVVIFVLADLAPNVVLGFMLRGELKRYLGKRVEIGKAQGQLVSAGWIDCVLKDKEVFALPYRYVKGKGIRTIR